MTRKPGSSVEPYRRNRTDLVDVGNGPALKERDLEKTCSDLLELDGWRPLKTDPVSRHEWGKGFGEKGMCDRLYIRYLDKAELVFPGGRMVLKPPAAEVLWIEWKRIRAGRRTATKAAPHQKTWIMAERARGALVILAGEDFPATWEGFKLWYRKSGLMRRPGLC